MNFYSHIIWIGIILKLVAENSSGPQTKSYFKFTNIKCDDHDKTFSSFEVCKLKVVGRGLVTLNVRVGLYKSPVTNSTINIAMFKRASGYKPFLYNVTQDVCAFFANRSKYPILKVLLSIFLKGSNLNHTCPYNDAIIVKDLVLQEDMFNLFPIPEGDYMFKVKVFAYNDLKATVQAFFTRQDPLIAKRVKANGTRNKYSDQLENM